MTAPAAVSAVRALLTTPVLDYSAGYLDLLEPQRSAQSLAQRIMENGLFAAVYERAWRPVFTRLFSLGGSSTLAVGQQLIGHLARPGDRLVLDVGCGPGLHTAQVARGLTGSGLCVGLDFSTQMLAQAVADNSTKRAVYVRGDAHRLPFADYSFDAVSCLAALYLVTDPLKVVDEMVRVLTPGGEFAIFTSMRTPLSSSPPVQLVAAASGYHIFDREIIDRLVAAGMTKIRRTVTGQGQYVTAVAPNSTNTTADA